MRIGGFELDERVLIVAEIGNNHEGDPAVARELVLRAAECGADAVKLQTFRTERYVSPSDEERFRRLKSFELPPDEVAGLAALARERDLLFLSAPFDLDSADLLAGLVDAFKIASGDNDFFPLIGRVSDTGKPLIVSTGLADLDELRRTVKFVRARRGDGDPELALLHCVSAYPVPDEEANLLAIPTLARELGCPVGYSDHTVGLDAAPLAVALGARIVEKHFTLDRDFSDFRDHKLSADPDGLRELVRRVRAAEAMLGSGAKVPQPSELGVLTAVRRSIAAARDLPAGHEVGVEDLTWLRPAGGLRPGEEEALLGKALRRAVREGEPLRRDDVG